MDTFRSRSSVAETSPDRCRAKVVSMQPKPTKPIPLKVKVQVVYYLCRNGHLEHPHYIQLTHFSNHPLRLRDVMDRLTLLRGKAMLSLYSWSCKRSYKNGFVWNDLGYDDVIYPSDHGAEYVLKGSELLHGYSERFQQQQDANNRQIVIQEPSLHGKGKHHIPSQHETQTSKLELEEYTEQDVEQVEESQEEYEDEEEKTSCYTSSTTPHSRCSRGVSTTEPTHHDSFPSPPNPSIKTTNTNTNTNNTSTRFEDGDPVVSGSGTTRNSVLLQLISCGNLNLTGPRPKNNIGAQSESNVQKGVLYKTAIKLADEEDVINIRYMSENPRFGNLQSEGKEYFSGSIVDNPVADHSEVACLKRCNSYNQERSQKEAFEGEKGEEEEDIMKEKDKTGRGKCIPRKVFKK